MRKIFYVRLLLLLLTAWPLTGIEGGGLSGIFFGEIPTLTKVCRRFRAMRMASNIDPDRIYPAFLLAMAPVPQNKLPDANAIARFKTHALQEKAVALKFADTSKIFQKLSGLLDIQDSEEDRRININFVDSGQKFYPGLISIRLEQDHAHLDNVIIVSGQSNAAITTDYIAFAVAGIANELYRKHRVVLTSTLQSISGQHYLVWRRLEELGLVDRVYSDQFHKHGSWNIRTEALESNLLEPAGDYFRQNLVDPSDQPPKP